MCGGRARRSQYLHDGSRTALVSHRAWGWGPWGEVTPLVPSPSSPPVLTGDGLARKPEPSGNSCVGGSWYFLFLRAAGQRDAPSRAGQATVGPSLPLPVPFQLLLPLRGGWLPPPALHGAPEPGPGVTDSVPLRGLIWKWAPCALCRGQGRGASGRATESPPQDVLRPKLSEDGKDWARQRVRFCTPTICRNQLPPKGLSNLRPRLSRLPCGLYINIMCAQAGLAQR